jgi:hypothetical protein
VLSLYALFLAFGLAEKLHRIAMLGGGGMKRSFLGILLSSIMLVIVMPLLLTSCTGIPVVEVTAVNVIQNTGFEEPTGNVTYPPDNWTSVNTSLGRSIDAYSGNYSAYIYGANTSYTQTVRIKAVALYRFVGYVKSNNSTATLNLTVQDSDGEPVASDILWLAESMALKLEPHVILSTNQTVWEKDMVYFYSPETAYYAVIKLEMTPKGGASNPEAWFDDILLEEKYECFIATAAYGTSTASEIDTLRAFRDKVLLKNSLGSQLVAFYYDVSPPVADFISEHDVLRTLVKELLVEPVVSLVEVTETLWRD